MNAVVKTLACFSLVAIGSWTLTGCGTSNATADKMGMSDGKMGEQKMGMEASDKMMEPAKMGDGKMSGGKMDDKMGDAKMEKK